MRLDSIRRSGVVVLVLGTASVAMVVDALGWRRYLVLGTATLALKTPEDLDKAVELIREHSGEGS